LTATLWVAVSRIKLMALRRMTARFSANTDAIVQPGCILYLDR
jgi:hypothetical protein